LDDGRIVLNGLQGLDLVQRFVAQCATVSNHASNI